VTANTNFPDLVRRAAERLNQQKDAGNNVPELSGSAVIQVLEPLSRNHNETASGSTHESTQLPGRSVVISSTALAASGIVLPSAGAGFELTIEEFRSVKRHVIANISRSAAGQNGAISGRVILVTSARPGDGKTFTSINLALALAFERDQKVVLIDADAQRQTLINYMGIKAETGWIDLLMDTGATLADVLLHTNIPNLSILPAGKLPPDVPELIGSRKMGKFIADLSARNPNQIIIFDSQPCLVSNEPAILAEQVGQIVFVVAADETSREEVTHSLASLGACPTVSLILNKGLPLLTEQFTKYGYGYKYQQQQRA